MALMLDMNLSLPPEMRPLATRLGVGLLLLVVVAYVLIVMPLREGKRLDEELVASRERIERQQALLPALTSIAASSQNASLAAVMPPKLEPVPRTRVYLMPEEIAHMARAVGLEPVEVTLNPASMAQDPNSIQAQGIFSGQMEAVRGMLMSLGRMPSLARMERVEIRAVDGRLEMLVQLRIALSN